MRLARGGMLSILAVLVAIDFASAQSFRIAPLIDGDIGQAGVAYFLDLAGFISLLAIDSSYR